MYDGIAELETQECGKELDEKKRQLYRVYEILQCLRRKRQKAIYMRSENWWDTLEYYKGRREELEQRITLLDAELRRREGNAETYTTTL